jgi:Predicted transcription factor, homolog of eukaryotic MBF1
MFDFGLTLKRLREERGYSQAQLSRKLNVSKSSVSKYESNQSMPSVETLTRLALIYGVSLDYLVGIEKNKTISVEGLTNRQLDILNTLLAEFRSK